MGFQSRIFVNICDTRKDDWKNDKYSICHDLDKKTEKFEEIISLSATWFRKDLYDKLGLRDRRESDGLSIGHHELLIQLGFEFVKDENESKKISSNANRYHLVYKKGKLKIHSDGTWIKNDGIYSLNDFKEFCKEKGEDIDIEKVKFNSYNEQVYELLLPSVKEKQLRRIKAEKECKKAFEQIQKVPTKESKKEELLQLIESQLFLLEFSEPSRASYDVESLFCVVEYSNTAKGFFGFCKEHVLLNLDQKPLKSNILDWLSFRSNLFLMGRYLYPIGTSPQFGEHKLLKRLYEKILEVAKNDIKSYEEEE